MTDEEEKSWQEHQQEWTRYFNEIRARKEIRQLLGLTTHNPVEAEALLEKVSSYENAKAKKGG